MAAVYQIRNSVNGKVYVGSAVNVRRRWRVHRNRLRAERHHSPPLQLAWAKYGADAFAFEVLEDGITPECVVAREQAWIDRLRPAYNVCPTAGSTLGRRHAARSREKTAKSLRGKSRPPGVGEKIAVALRGRTQPPELVAKRADANRGKKRSAATRAKLALVCQRNAAAKQGKPITAEHREKIVEALRARVHTAESKAKASESLRKYHARGG